MANGAGTHNGPPTDASLGELVSGCPNKRAG